MHVVPPFFPLQRFRSKGSKMDNGITRFRLHSLYHEREFRERAPGREGFRIRLGLHRP